MFISRARPYLVALSLLLGACGGGGDDRAVDVRPTTTDAAPEKAKEKEPGRPAAGECRGPTDWDIYMARSDDRPTLPCDGPHGSEVYFVGDVEEPLASLSTTETADGTPGHERLTEAVSERCGTEFHRITGLGPDREVVRILRIVQAIFLPTPVQWDAGARWFRCDLILPPEGDREAPDAPEATESPLIEMAAMDTVPPELRSCTTFDSSLILGCTTPHSIERLVVFLDRNEAAGALGGEELSTYLRETYVPRCRAEFLEFTGQTEGNIRTDLTYTVTRTSDEEWADGRRSTECMAFPSSESAVLIDSVEGIGPTRPLPLQQPSEPSR